jgi:hypothetical protein
MSTNIEPTSQHQWLKRLIGDWTFQHDIPAHDGHPATTIRGTETFRPIGDFWVQGEASSPGPDGTLHVSVMTIGFDPATGRFVGSWIGSMMPNLWVYDGELDGGGRSLALYSRGPAMDGSGGMADYKDVVGFVSDTHRTLTGHQKAADGTWQQFMKVDYRRA